jgi:nucleoside 2-deoxyribosyltransferase
MIKKVFICYSYGNREKYREFHEKLKEWMSGMGINVYSFVFDYTEKSDPKTMMRFVKNEIDSSDLLLGELSDESVGVGLEIGYAHGKGIKTGYLYKVDSFNDPVIAGIVDYVIEYSNADDVISWFKKYFTEI